MRSDGGQFAFFGRTWSTRSLEERVHRPAEQVHDLGQLPAAVCALPSGKWCFCCCWLGRCLWPVAAVCLMGQGAGEEEGAGRYTLYTFIYGRQINIRRKRPHLISAHLTSSGPFGPHLIEAQCAWEVEREMIAWPVHANKIVRGRQTNALLSSALDYSSCSDFGLTRDNTDSRPPRWAEMSRAKLV